MSRELPQAVREVLAGLDMELRWLNASWRVFGQLFGGTGETAALLDESAQSFFRLTQDAFQERIFLILTRISDPGEVSGKSNLSIPRLMSLLEVEAPFLRGELVALEGRLDAAVADIRLWRHKVIAHRDLRVFLEQDVVPAIERQAVDEAMRTAGEIVNRTRHYYGMSHMLFEAGILDGDGNRVISLLRKAKANDASEAVGG